MTKPWRTILIVVACLGFIGFLSLSYWYKTEGPAMAIDYNTNTEIMCEEPIPVGIAIDKTVDFLDDIYQRYQGETVQNASKQVDALMTDIANGGKICDFNIECKAQVGTAGPEVGLEFNAYFWSGRVGGAVPSCKLKEATGNPCPDLGKYVGEQTPEQWLNEVNPETLSLNGLANSLSAEADNIHGLFSVADTPVPFGLEEKGEAAGTMISKADLVKRYIADIDNWLTPNPQKNTCALSELDRKRIEQGKMGDKYPMQCLEALHQEMYTPKAWSETCQDECETFSQECKTCLAKCEGTSVYASLNCKIYSFGDKQGALNKCSDCWFDKTTCLDGETCGKDCVFNKEGSVTGDEYCHSKVQVKIGENPKCAFISGQSKQCCGSVCADGFNTQCKECLCAGEKADQPLSQEKCLDWICGGSKANWVCCHEEPIQNPAYYVVDGTESNKNILLTKTSAGFHTRTSVYDDNINKTSSGLPVEFGVLAGTSEIPFGTCVQITKIGLNENNQPSPYDSKIQDFANQYVVTNSSGEKDNQFFCITDRGGEKIESGERFDIWLNKNDSSYYTSDLMSQWGVRNTTLQYWYDKNNPCVKNGKLKLGACEVGPPSAGADLELITADGFEHMKFAYSIENQWPDVSNELKDLLHSIDGTVSDNFVVNSISDSAGIDICSDKKTYSETICAHAQYSCHYGGTKCNGGIFSSAKSYAADISFSLPSEGAALVAAQAACLYGADITSVKESDPAHYHISIKNKDCGCDVGLKESNKVVNICAQ